MSAPRVPREGLFLALILLACFTTVDRVLVRARTRAYHEAEKGLKAAEDRFWRARSEAARKAALEDALASAGGEKRAAPSPVPTDFLNAVLRERRLRNVDLRADVGARGARGESFQVTVQGSYGNLVLFLRDLEASRVPVWLRDVRISRVADEGTTLEMRVRLEIEGTTS